MTTKTIECVECGEPVPYGRLSCPACGALLAAVSPPPWTATASARGPVDQTAAAAFLIDPAAPMPTDPETEAWRAPWPPLDDAGPVLVARAYGRDSTSDAGEPGPVAPTPGAYVPPNLALASARATVGDRPAGGPIGGAAPAAAASGVALTLATVPVTPARPAIDAARVVEVAGWFVVVGSVMALLGFVLPWSVAVIGASGSASYLDRWGLASPSHILVVAGLLAVLALGVVHTPVPTWLRTGVVGLGLGGLLFGLTWPYLLGPLGADIGVLVTGLGGLALVIGGGVASWATRHEGTDPIV